MIIFMGHGCGLLLYSPEIESLVPPYTQLDIVKKQLLLTLEEMEYKDKIWKLKMILWCAGIIFWKMEKS